MRKVLSVIGVGMLLAGCAGGSSPYVFPTAAVDAPEAHINFVQNRGIYDYHAISDRLLYVQSRDRNWYQVTMFAPCIGLPYTNGVRFLPSDGAGTFDRFSSIAFRGQRCKVESVKAIPQPQRTDGYVGSAMRGTPL